VDAEVVLDTDRRQPVELLLVLHGREKVLELVVGDEEDEYQAEVREESDLLHQRVVATARVGHGRDGHRCEDRNPDQEAEQDRGREDACPCRTCRRWRRVLEDGGEQHHRATPGATSAKTSASTTASTMTTGSAGAPVAASANWPVAWATRASEP